MSYIASLLCRQRKKKVYADILSLNKLIIAVILS